MNKHVSSKSSVVLPKVNSQSEYIHWQGNYIALAYRKFSFWFHHPSANANAPGRAADGLKTLVKIRSSALSGEPNGTKNRSEATGANICGDWRIVALSTTETIKVVLAIMMNNNFMVCFWWPSYKEEIITLLVTLRPNYSFDRCHFNKII
jgi:hypothetical protein